MGLHDWTRVGDNVFHALHVAWLTELQRVLNGGILPPEYLARAEEHVGPWEADLLTLEVGAEGGGPADEAPRTASELQPTATIAPPRLRRERRIAVFSARDERRVAVLEVGSRGNKDSERRVEQFVQKMSECLGSSLHALVVDVWPKSGAADGLGAEVARRLGAATALAGGRGATSFECAIEPDRIEVYHRALELDAALPDVPLFLEPGRHVVVPLEETYQRALETLPRRDRDLLEA